MGKYLAWFVRHEKLVVAITFALVIALVVQVRFCQPHIEPEARLPLNQPQASQIAQSSGSTSNVAGRWEMSIQKRKGGTQIWTLTLEQSGELLKGVINSEGGDLSVTGNIKGPSINLAAKRLGVTVEFSATFNGDTMTGTMRALTVTRQWRAKRM